nr:uncharacterized mitochondrial protein AtMg00810-like [Tanacetum cinerariifolium]
MSRCDIDTDDETLNRGNVVEMVRGLVAVVFPGGDEGSGVGGHGGRDEGGEVATAVHITAENKANHTVGPKETNNSACTQDSFDAGTSEMEADHAQEYYIKKIWRSLKGLKDKKKKQMMQLKFLERGQEGYHAQVYVDDIIFGSTKKSWCHEFEALMKNRFQMSSMGELTYFLGLQVKQKEDGIFISQDKYVAEIQKKFNFLSVKTASTHIETKKPLVKDEEAADVDVHLYRSMIGSLMFLTTSRPNIMYAVCTCSRFQVTPKTSHLQAIKRIFRYLKGQPKLGLWYPRESAFDLEAYLDIDYAGANHDRKSTTGGCQFLGRRLISWQCKKQTIVATLTTKAEYVAAVSCCGQVLWIQN